MTALLVIHKRAMYSEFYEFYVKKFFFYVEIEILVDYKDYEKIGNVLIKPSFI